MPTPPGPTLGPLLDLWWHAAVPVLTHPWAVGSYALAAVALAAVRATRRVPVAGPCVRGAAFGAVLPACFLAVLAWRTLGVARRWQARLARLAGWSYGVAAWGLRGDPRPLAAILLAELVASLAYELRRRAGRRTAVARRH